MKSFYETSFSVSELLYKMLLEEGFLEKDPQKIKKFYTIVMILGVVTLNPLFIASCVLFSFHLPRKTKLGA